MKKSNWFMKLLVILPAALLVVLLTWMAVDWWNLNHGTESRDQVTFAEAVTQEESRTEESTSESGSEPSADEVLKLNLSESEETREEESSSESETEAGDPILHLLFGGDVYLSDHVIQAYDNAGGIHGVLDDGYRAEIGAADIFMVNQEFPFSDRGTPAPDKTFTFRLPPARVAMLSEMGIDIVALANNHSLDYGTDALVDTCTTLEGAGIPYVGAGPNMDRAKKLETLEVRGRTVGFLAGSRVFPDTSWVANSQKPGMVSGYDPKILLEETEKAGEFCDYLVVYMHWGVEREEMPKDYQRALGKKLIDAGADLVIGSHPHVLQGIEYYNGKPIVYSLGNFVFGSSIPKTALLRADVDLDQDSVTLSLVPGTSGAGFTRELTDAGKIAEFYRYIEGISFGIVVDGNGYVSPVTAAASATDLPGRRPAL